MKTAISGNKHIEIQPVIVARPQTLLSVGNKEFTADIQQQLASRAHKRSIVPVNGSIVLKEPEITYNTVFDGKKRALSPENTYLWG